jgi:hypothetical protein
MKLTNTNISINEQTLGYTLKLTDDGKLIDMNSGSSITLTVPRSISVNFPIGTTISIRQKGVGKVTIAPFDGNVIINNTSGLKIISQYGIVSLLKVAMDTWALSGPLEV